MTYRRAALLLVVAMLITVLPPLRAQAAPPTPVVPLPPEVDLIDAYEGQSLCDPAPKPGTLKLRDTLWRTYGSGIWAGISRDCNVSWDPGISEHKDGRAIDWGVSVRNPATKAAGDEFFAWATANNGEMARRMGIMYIIWDSRMWRLYDMGRGFPEYRNCVSQLTSTSYDTTCHRDHMHISMTWHGAGSATSWYDGTAVTQPACTAGEPIVVQPGSRSAASVMFDPVAGVGVKGGKPCYLGKSIQTLRVPVDGPAAISLRVSGTSSNSPSGVRIWTNGGGRISVGPGAAPAEQVLPVGGDGLVYLQQPIGQSSIRLEGLGQSRLAQADAQWLQHPGVAYDVAFAQISGGWEMFHVGNGNAVYRMTYRNGTRTAWTEVPGMRAKRLAATTSPDGRVELFHIGLDDAIYHNWERSPGGDLGSATRFDGSYATAIAAARSGGIWELYHVGASGTIWRMNGAQGDWQPFSGTWASELAATTSDDGRVELFHIGRDQQTWHATQIAPGGGFAGPAGPGSWRSYGDRSTGLSAADGIGGSFELYTVGTGGSVWRLAPGSSRDGWSRFTGTASRLAATNSPDGRVEVVRIGDGGGIYHTWQRLPGWY